MATQFLRKIILEELQKVLKEQMGLEVYKSGQNRAKGYPSDTDPFGGQGPIDPSQAPLGSPLNPRDSAPFVDPQYTRSKSKPKVKSKAQLRREAVRRMQKELERLGYPGGLQKPGVFDDFTLDYLQKTFPGIDKTRTPDSISTNTINTFVSFLKKKPTGGYADIALGIEKEMPLQTPNVSAGQTGMGVAPPASPVATDNLGTTRKEEEPNLDFLGKSETAAEKSARYKKQEEERRKAQQIQRRTSNIQEQQQESITREINKLLKML